MRNTITRIQELVTGNASKKGRKGPGSEEASASQSRIPTQITIHSGNHTLGPAAESQALVPPPVSHLDSLDSTSAIVQSRSGPLIDSSSLRLCWQRCISCLALSYANRPFEDPSTKIQIKPGN